MVQGVQFRRGTTADHAGFTGQSGEITVDTSKNVAVVHDGVTAGGNPLVGSSTTQRITNKDINATALNVSGVATATTFSGTLNGTATTATVSQGLTGTPNITVGFLTATSGVQGIGIYSGGNLVTTGIITALNFVGTGNTFAVVGNRVDISIAGGTGTSSGISSQFSRTITTFTATSNQTTFSVAYNIGYVDVYLNGARLSSSEFTAADGTSVVLSTGATLNDIIDIISYSGSGNALWNVGIGSSIYSLSNVGIGTTNPTSKLDVVGDVRIVGATTITGNLNAAGNYYAKLARLTNQTIPVGTDTLIGFTAMSDTNGWYSGITTRTTPTVAGTYQVQAMLNWQAGSTTNINQSNIQLRKNGNTFAIALCGIQTFQYNQYACGIVTMNGSTDYIEFTAYTSNATSQAVTGDAGATYTKLEMFKIN